MPIPLRKFGSESIRMFRQMDERFIKDIRAYFKKDLKISLEAWAQKVAVDIFENGQPDWELWRRQETNYFSQLNTTLRLAYVDLAKMSQKATLMFFLLAKKRYVELFKLLYPAKFVTIKKENEEEFLSVETTHSEIFEAEASPKIVISLGKGTPNDQFKQMLKGQLDNKTEPSMLIKTLSADHVKVLQRDVAAAVSAGQGVYTAKEDFLKKVLPTLDNAELTKKMEYNVLRIMRTSYNTAVNEDFTKFMSDNQHLFEKKIRMADGRPCLACVMLDGKEYDIAAPMNDHIAGMCYFIPVAKTLEDLGFDTSKLPTKLSESWSNYSQDVPLMQSRFWQLPESEQRKIFGNQALFDLWKKEQFPIDRLARISKEGWSIPISYKDALAKLPELGGISNPLCKFIGTTSIETIKDLNKVIDPLDRATKGLSITSKGKKGLINQYGIDPYGWGKDLSKVPDSVLADVRRFSTLVRDPETMPWYDFNQRARILGLYTRKAVDGRMYYAVGGDAGKLKTIALPKGAPPPVTAVKTLSYQEYIDLDSDIDLLAGKNLDKIRWDKDGIGHVLVDGKSVEAFEVKIYKTAGGTYSFQFKITDEASRRLWKEMNSGKFLKLRNVDEKYRLIKKTDKGFVFSKKDFILDRKNRVFVQSSGKTTITVNLPYFEKFKTINSFSNQVWVDSKSADLAESLQQVKKDLKEYDIGSWFAPTIKNDKDAYISARYLWADGKKVMDVNDVSFVNTDEYVSMWDDLPLPEEFQGFIHLGSSESVEAVFDSKQFLSTEQRLARGFFDDAVGMSPRADLETGGANGVFVRPVTSLDINYASTALDSSSKGHVVYVFKKDIAKRLDWYGFSGDKYGDVTDIKYFSSKGRTSYFHSLRKERPDGVRYPAAAEVVFRNSIDFSNVEYVICHKLERWDLITKFISKGITKINGKDIADFFVEAKGAAVF
ncbi:hypothetical protein C4561_01815 [candidate division WWE3 bacterium]|uniref:Uncharacterized protein n=1 Tax=candidate division WWE3 bacterium TaxID=2053526 RepID=A0A3A4ZMB9_UNCKA|nr:MAG: hypothetical protein C4561_01815 [candidate division WWE3 bacterium]